MTCLLHNASLSQQSSRKPRHDAVDASPGGRSLARPERYTGQENAPVPPGAHRGNTLMCIFPPLQEPGQGYCGLQASDTENGEGTVGRPMREITLSGRVQDNLLQQPVEAAGDTVVSPTASSSHAVTLHFTVLAIFVPLPRDAQMICLLSCVAMNLYVVPNHARECLEELLSVHLLAMLLLRIFRGSIHGARSFAALETSERGILIIITTTRSPHHENALAALRQILSIPRFATLLQRFPLF